MTESRTQATTFAALKGWAADDHLAAFRAFLVSAKRMMGKPYKTRELGASGEVLATLAAKALVAKVEDSNEARLFFEANFEPHKLVPDKGAKAGFVTGFFEPQMQAALEPSNEFPEPLYARPPELIDIDENNRPADMDHSYRYGWQKGDRISEAPDRGQINQGALQNRGLEIVWLRNKVDAFFIHVQGAAKLVLPNGKFIRVTYAAKSGHDYTSLGRLLCERLNISTAHMTSDVLRDWMLDHPDQLDELLANNRSYIFFEVSDNNGVGPIAAAKVPLVPHRSMAVDRSLHTFGCPFFVSTHRPLPGESEPFRKLMIAHDTGSAILGTARGDIFCGTGDEAGLQAGRIQHATDMVVLMPKVSVS